MPRGATSLFVLLALLSAPAAAFAEDAERDPWGVLPQDERRFHRDGFAIGFGLGPAVFYGSGSQSDFGGVGASARLRLGTSASRSLMWLMELAGGSYLESIPAGGEAMDGDETELARNEEATLTFGAQWFFGEVFFLRGALGFARSITRDRDEVGADLEVTEASGLAFVGAAGADVFRSKSIAIDVELAVNSDLYDGGFLGRWQLALAFNWY